MLTIEQKLSTIKAINDKITQLESAKQKVDLGQGINWELMPTEVTAQINDIVRKCYNQQREELIAKATELMK